MRNPDLLLTLLFMSSVTLASAQQIESVTLIPQNPTTSNEVSLAISGQRLSSDMGVESITVQQSGNAFIVSLNFISGGVGLPVLMPFDTTVSLGTLAAGDYTATVTGISLGTPFNSVPASWTVSMVTGIGSAPQSGMTLSAVPNPFSHSLVISVNLSESSKVRLALFDILGKEVAVVTEGTFAAGNQEFRLDAHSLPDGRYYLQSVINGQRQTRALIKRGN